MTLSGGGGITYASTSTGKTIASNGISYGLNSVYFNGVGGGWTFSDSSTIPGSVYLSAGTVNTNGFTMNWLDITKNSSSTAVLTLGSSTINVTRWSLAATTTTGLTVNSNTSNIVLSGGYGAFDGGGFTYYNVSTSFTTQTPYIKGANTFNNLSISITGSKTSSISLFANQIVNGIFTINGNSAINRLLIQSDTLGTPRTITAATVGTCSNVDFMDIVGAGAGSWNLSAISGGAGQCGGNGGITFTTAQNQYWRQTVTGNANWSDTSKWFLATGGTGGAGRVPLPQDTAIFDANSFTVSACQVAQDMPRIGSMNWTGVTNNPTYNTNTTAGGVPYTCFGNYIISATMTPILGYVYLTFGGRGSYSITSAGAHFSFPRFFLAAPGGTYTQTDNFVSGSGGGFFTAIFNPMAGTWNSNGFSFESDIVDGTQDQGGNTFAGTATLSMGASTWTIKGNDTNNNPSTATWRVPTGMTITAGTSTILLNDSTSNAKTFYGGGKIYYNLTLGGSGTGAFVVQDTNTTFTHSTNITCSGAANVTLFGSTGMQHQDIDFTGFVGTWIGSTAGLFGGNIIMATGMTNSFTGNLTFVTTIGSYLIYSNGKTFASNFNLGTVSSIANFALNDNFTTSGSFTVSFGNFNTNNHDMSCGSFSSSNSNTRSITLGTSTVSITSISLTGWTVATATSLTLSAASSIIKFISGGTSAASFQGGSQTYGTIWNARTGSGTGGNQLNLTGNNTINVLKCDPAKFLDFQGGTTTTIASASGFQCTGTSGNLVILKSITNGTAWNIVCASGTVSGDYMSLQDSHASGGATFQAGSNSTNVSGNTGWIFGALANTFFLMF